MLVCMVALATYEVCKCLIDVVRRAAAVCLGDGAGSWGGGEGRVRS